VNSFRLNTGIEQTDGQTVGQNRALHADAR